MVVFYRDIIHNIQMGGEHFYSEQSLKKLGDWLANDKRSQVAIDKERKEYFKIN